VKGIVLVLFLPALVLPAWGSATSTQNIYPGTAKSLVPSAHSVGFARISTSHPTTFGTPLRPGLKSGWQVNYRRSSPQVGATALIGVYTDQTHARAAYTNTCGGCKTSPTTGGIRMEYSVDSFSDGRKLFVSETTCRNLYVHAGVVGRIGVEQLRRDAGQISTRIYARAIAHGMAACKSCFRLETG
jgi:hypothetical protein